MALDESTKLLLVDKDGTLVRPKYGKYVEKPWEQKALEGVEENLCRYFRQNWVICVISNQGGVEAGYKLLESCILEMQYVLELFPVVSECFFCPDFQGNDCYRIWRGGFVKYTPSCLDVSHLQLAGLFRKPNPGMLKLASYIYPSDQIVYVGDREEDLKAAEAAKIKFMDASAWRLNA